MFENSYLDKTTLTVKRNDFEKKCLKISFRNTVKKYI